MGLPLDFLQPHVQYIIPYPDDSSRAQITFNREMRLPVDLPSWNLVKQMYKTGYLQSRFGQEVQGSDLERALEGEQI
jgi:hypothetical protein